MSKEHVTYRMIGGTCYRCQDIGCDDFDRAEYNRFIVKSSLFNQFYNLVSEAVAHTPLNQPLAKWIPRGELPQISRGDWQAAGGERGSGFELLELEVVGA